jgi:hypothetical protein
VCAGLDPQRAMEVVHIPRRAGRERGAEPEAPVGARARQQAGDGPGRRRLDRWQPDRPDRRCFDDVSNVERRGDRWVDDELDRPGAGGP